MEAAKIHRVKAALTVNPSQFSKSRIIKSDTGTEKIDLLERMNLFHKKKGNWYPERRQTKTPLRARSRKPAAPNHQKGLTMSKLLDHAVETVRSLPPEDQDEIAAAMLALAGVEPEPVDPAHLSAVLEGLAQARRREFANPAEIEAAFRRFGG